MLYHKKGDLLQSDCTVIMHQANCFSTMGAGIAKSIANMYPEAAVVDREYMGSPQDKLGMYSFVTVNDVTIVNLYGQFNFGPGRQTDYEMLEKAIDGFLGFAKTHKNIDISKVGVPYKMGCGLAGGSWDVVHDILGKQSTKHGIDIYIYEL